MRTYRILGGGMAFIALLLAAPARPEAPGMIDPIPAATARAVVHKTIALVEADGLYPRSRDEYAAAKARLLGALDSAGEQVDRPALFQHITAMLQTLDADGHTMIFPPVVERQFRQDFSVARSAPRISSFSLVPTAHGQVLHWTPPQSYGDLKTEGPLFVQRFTADYAALRDAAGSCALVLDLGGQHGGNAWPVLMTMHPVLSQANRAVFVKRDGARERLFDFQQLPGMQAYFGGDARNPLARFSGQPLAVVIDGKTSSAGEMLLVALLGEGERIQTFGHTSQGSTTANRSHVLPDGSMLLLTTSRYALGDTAPIRGGIPPQVPAPAGATHASTVRQAAEWAAMASPLCRQ